jgi:hypothetical protein
MQYAQLNEDGTYSHQITTSGNVLWDENNFCPASALIKDGKAEQFRVVELHEVDPPTIDPMTQSVIRDGGEYVEERWQYKWRVDDLSPEQIAENLEKKNQKLRADIVTKTQARLDNFASSRNYAGILSLCTYATSTNAKFQAEGQYGVEARDETWAKLYEILAEVEAGTRPAPSSYAEIEPELPELQWPE